jgi:hypothetical protein
MVHVCLTSDCFQRAPWTNSRSGPAVQQPKTESCTRSAGFDHFADASLLSSEIHRRAHEIALAELDAAMAQDVIRRCAVKIEVR